MYRRGRVKMTVDAVEDGMVSLLLRDGAEFISASYLENYLVVIVFDYKWFDEILATESIPEYDIELTVNNDIIPEIPDVGRVHPSIYPDGSFELFVTRKEN